MTEYIDSQVKTDLQIKVIGAKLWLRKRMKRLILLYVIGFVWWFIVGGLLHTSSVNNFLVSIAPLFLVIFNMVWTMIQAANIYLDKYKEAQKNNDATV